jgi:pseudouridine-5'-phosphate glycosidase
VTGTVRLAPEVRAALAAGSAVVGLETSVVAQGLPAPHNATAAADMGAAVRNAGATPALTAVVRGDLVAGLEGQALQRFLARTGIAKASARDLPVAMAAGADAATTVAGSLVICRLAGIPVLATGGIGGVHREPPFDESADLLELSRTAVVVVCSGAKAVLDLAATAERLETLGVTVVGFGTDEFPGFYCRESGLKLDAVVGDVDGVVAIARAQRRAGIQGALLVVQPPPAEAALPCDEVEAAVATALAAARRERIRGAVVTPFLLAAVEGATAGRSLRCNLALLSENARLAGEIARRLAAASGG